MLWCVESLYYIFQTLFYFGNCFWREDDVRLNVTFSKFQCEFKLISFALN